MLILAGCATPEDIGRMQYDLINLRSKVNDIDSRIPGRGGRLNERLAGLEEGQGATNRSVSDMLMNVQSLTAELQILTGRFDEVQYSSEKSSRELTENQDTMTSQIKTLEAAVNELKATLAGLELQLASPEKQKPVEKAKKTENGEKTPETEAKDIYMDAYRTFKEKKFKAAREQFEALLEKYPESELSDNARFWIGESYYRGKNYEDAILSYQELFDKNPQSNKVPGALLKQGLAFYELKKERIGKTILDQLVEKFPDSEQAGIAKKKLNPTRDPREKRTVPPKKKQ